MQENEGRQRAPQVGEMALFFHLVGAQPLLRVELQEALDELLGGGADGIPPGAREVVARLQGGERHVVGGGLELGS